MSREEFLRESLRRAAATDAHPGDAWARFQRKRARANAWRTGVVSAGALGVALTLFFTLPGLNQRAPDSFFGNELRPNLKTYVDPIVGFQFDYPDEWIVEGAPGQDVTVHPPGEYARTTKCPGCHPDETEHVLAPYVMVDIEKLDPASKCALPKCGGPYLGEGGVSDSWSSRTIDGSSASVNDSSWPAAPTTDLQSVTYWCASCHQMVAFIDDPFGATKSWSVTLVLRFPEGMKSSDVDAAQAIIDSFRRYLATPPASVTWKRYEVGDSVHSGAFSFEYPPDWFVDTDGADIPNLRIAVTTWDLAHGPARGGIPSEGKRMDVNVFPASDSSAECIPDGLGHASTLAGVTAREWTSSTRSESCPCETVPDGGRAVGAPTTQLSEVIRGAFKYCVSATSGSDVDGRKDFTRFFESFHFN